MERENVKEKRKNMKEQQVIKILSDVLKSLCNVNTTVRIGKIWTNLYSRNDDLYRETCNGKYWPNLNIKDNENYNTPLLTTGVMGFGAMFTNDCYAVNWDLGGGIYIQRDKFETSYIIHTPNGQCKDSDLNDELRMDFDLIMQAIFTKTPINHSNDEWNKLKRRNNYTLGLKNDVLKTVAYEILNDNRLHRRRKQSKYKIALDNIRKLGVYETPRLESKIMEIKSKVK